MKQSVFMEDEMPRGHETAKIRMPKQYVREGRGVAGYLGNVEVYDPKPVEEPKNVKRISGTKAKDAPEEDK